ncbi:clumping factor B-like [Macrobrachium nipponense]|uniref:clumping factor B-like n=1 Tax=Macrobrachium nipponense TaxID=159736 RepID=UPI0030C7E8D7
MSVEVLLPSPRVNMLDTGTLNAMEGLALPKVCGPHRGIRRPSGTNESESDSPPSKKSKKARRRRKRPRQRLIGKGLQMKPVAPFNTTQFLMAEHDQLQDTDIVVRPRRHRDSSFSVESDDQNNFYSSPEDEDEFMAREFWNAYEDVHAERLDTMTKAQLVQEYLALEEKVDLLERQLRAVRARHRYRSQRMEDDDDDDDDEVRPGEVKVDPETAQKISIFQREISNLEVENRRLREENLTLRRTSSARSSSSSSSSDSSSDSSSSSSSDSSSDSEADGDAEAEDNRTQKSSSPSRVNLDDGEAVVSASDKVECQPDSHLCQEEDVESGEEEPAEATPVVVIPERSVDGDGPSPVTQPDPPTSSSATTAPVEGGEGRKDGKESPPSAVAKGVVVVEEEVSSTTAA